MKSFELTPEQISIISNDLNSAKKAYYKNKPGIILAQIQIDNDEDIICQFQFIEHDMAKKIVSITNPKGLEE